MKSKRNDPASVALVALRKTMKKNQQEFAVGVLESALTTVSRYESGNPPPRGDVLLRLAGIAYEQNLPDLAKIFQRVWAENLPKIRGSYLTEDQFVVHISGKDAHRGAQAFMLWLAQLDNPKTRKQALSLLKLFE